MPLSCCMFLFSILGDLPIVVIRVYVCSSPDKTLTGDPIGESFLLETFTGILNFDNILYRALSEDKGLF